MIEEPNGRLLESALSVGVDLSAYSTLDLGCELARRLRDQQAHASYRTQMLHLDVMAALRDVVEQQIEVPENRRSLSLLRGQLWYVFHCWQHHGLPVKDAVFLEVGSGSTNPFARMFTHLMAGARRAWCLDLDPPANTATALQFLARVAGDTLIDPSRLFGDHPIERREILEHLAGFDLAKLRRADPSGVDRDRLDFLQRSVIDTGLPDHSVDVVVSNSVFEHLPDVDGALHELARITRAHGYAIHGIDLIDHRCYSDPTLHPLEFLTEPGDRPLVVECNRLRLCDFERKFARHGFRVLDQWPYIANTPVADIRDRLAEPWRSMTDAQLSPTWSTFLLQRTS